MYRISPLVRMVLLVSCVQGQTETVELEVQQSVEVEFFSTEAGVTEEAIVIFDDLPSNVSYQEEADRLTCAGLNLHASHITIKQLQAEGSEVYVDLTLDIADVGVDNWRKLGSFVGTPLQGATIPFSDTRFALDDNGVKTLADMLTSEVPVYRVRVSGKTSDDTSALSVELSIQSTLSNADANCPTGLIAPKGDLAVTLSHGVTVDFDTMEAGQPEEATIALGDLRVEEAFAAIHSDLTCAAIDKQRSSLRIMNLEGADENFKLAVQFRQQGEEAWTPLAAYQGGLTQDMYSDFDSASFALPTEGANTLATQAASDSPSFELRFEATAGSSISDLEIDIIVGLRFGTDTTGCSGQN